MNTPEREAALEAQTQSVAVIVLYFTVTPTATQLGLLSKDLLIHLLPQLSLTHSEVSGDADCLTISGSYEKH